MKRFVTSTRTALTLTVVGLMLAGCGSGGEASQDTSAGAPLAGQVQSSPDPNSPAAAGVTATPNAPVSKQLTLAWDPVAGATSYNLYWSTVPGVTPASGTKISVAGNSYVQTGLAAGTTYYYVVTAVDSTSESAASTQASGTTTL